MAAWAYECTNCRDEDTKWYVSTTRVADFPATVKIVKVKVGDQWLCARLDRNRRVQMEQMLLRDVVPTDAENCSDCKDS